MAVSPDPGTIYAERAVRALGARCVVLFDALISDGTLRRIPVGWHFDRAAIERAADLREG